MNANRPLEQFKKQVNGKRVGVIGIGVSNTPLIDVLLRCGAIVTARDKKDAALLGDLFVELKEKGVRLMLGEHYLDAIDEEILFKTPGMRGDHPSLVDAARRGTHITSEMEVFCTLCPASIIAVTGSDGKTTTSTLIYEMLRQAGHTCWLGGNIGTPLLSQLDEMKPDHYVVLELSSFQLQSMFPQPDVAVVTNVTPNHLDWHLSMDEYIEAKEHVFAHQTDGQRLVLNYDNETTRNMAQKAASKVVYFSRSDECKSGVLLRDRTIYYNETPVLPAKQIVLKGEHNVDNYMAAIAAVWGMVSVEDIITTASSFVGVPHRLEFVRRVDGVKYYNDSIASSPTRAMAGLHSFEEPLILLAGGYDKNIPFDKFGDAICQRTKLVVLFGRTAAKIERAIKESPYYLDSDVLILRASDLKDALLQAKDRAEFGDVVLLSPACASFDSFKNFEERGNLFKQYVLEFE